MLSKRKLLQLVTEQRVSGWDDPRMPTLSGIRRRGFTPEALRAFCGSSAPRAPMERRTLRCSSTFSVTTSTAAPRAPWPYCTAQGRHRQLPGGKEESVEVANNPEDPSAGTHQVPFSRKIYIEQDDFREVPPPKYFACLRQGSAPAQCLLHHGSERSEGRRRQHRRGALHLRSASRGGNSPDGRKVKSTMHWVSAPRNRSRNRLYESSSPSPIPTTSQKAATSSTISTHIRSKVVTDAKLEPSLATAKPGDRFQFKRVGYFCADPDKTRVGETGLQPNAPA